MALLPYLLDYDIHPRQRRNTLLGLDLATNDIISDIFHNYPRSWHKFSSLERDIGSVIKNDNKKFQVHLDVQHFSPEEISVKVADNYIIVEGQHEEKKDEHGFVSRQFKRRYALPKGYNGEAVESRLSSDGVLSITAPRQVFKGERVIPISQTGPVRRKIQEPDEVQSSNDQEPSNGEPQVKSPPKKKRR